MRQILSLTLLLTLAACGFSPLYGDRAASPQLSAVRIANMEGANGQRLRLLIEDRIHSHATPEVPRYDLKVTFTTYKEDLGIKDDDVATRARMSITARYTLTSLENPDEKPYTGKTRSFVSYNILSDPYSTTAAEEDALSRGFVQVADNITSSIALHLAGTKKAP